MKKILLALLLAACGTSETAPISPLDGDPDYAAILDETRAADGKTDDLLTCGAQTCARTLCGFTNAAGATPGQACFATDTSAAAYVRFSTGGAESVTRDSRDTPYRPVVRLDNTLFYGAHLWRFTSGENGLEIQYAEITEGAFLYNDPFRHGPEMSVYLPDFHGPGGYAGQGAFASSRSWDGQTRQGKWYTTKTGCQVTVTAAAPDGVKGSFTCSLVAADGGTLSMSGEFLAGATALDGPFIVAR